MRIAFLSCSTTLPGGPDRRADAFEHDQQMAALVTALIAGETVAAIDWRAPLADFQGFDVALIGTPWDYQDNRAAFLAKLAAIAALRVPVCNAPDVVRWNIDKGYLAQNTDVNDLLSKRIGKTALKAKSARIAAARS